jgi:hypothetical protein
MNRKTQPELLGMLAENKLSFFEFLKAKYPVFHNSNIFFRDLQYGIQRYFEKKEIKITYKEAEDIAGEFIKQLEKESVFTKVNNIGWRLNFPEFAAAIPFPRAE